MASIPDPTTDLDWAYNGTHHLTEAGVINGDVVMIWAHRSVDLVVAIMGTLASGATFSVLDSLYPPRPLAPLVRRYIDEEPNLKTEVPSLRIGDDGILAGDEVDGADIFAEVRAKAASRPDVIVGPDSNPTLSGSEGKPKVNLFFFLGLLTILSSAIYSPPILGSSASLPSKEDIQHEKIAEWVREHKPTHLTPAMGQILVGGATAEFPSLDSAFFVGDVLTTGDCRQLRKLAENANIVNMYGTTETQRAVSYFEIPSRSKVPNALDALGDTVLAGKGMQNVQLLVIDRQDRNMLCDVGEVGEVFRTSREIQLIAHVRSVKDPKGTFSRLRRSLEGYGMWRDDGLDTEYYVNLSDKQIIAGQGAILEEDDLMGSRTGLGTGVRPHIVNIVNAVPVNHVANVVVWKDELENYVTTGGQEKDQEQHALIPLYHFCVNDLLANTRAPELSDSNTVKVLKEDAEHWTGIDESSGYGVSRVDIGRFLRFLAETQFISWPAGRGRPLPEVNLTAAQLGAVGVVGGRGGSDAPAVTTAVGAPKL
ncbi:L-aminoadipate-semialdehyde dehydrogenase [Fusarium austroafricanum]|uniref:L-aminoadipate-semialdehyde dehydrogenase n=1 Tax=Fusarium austroafricanum TaxID=2364996 RepID=A0A8H4KPB9_9HYPO|nr:L-aminoadipate-semialdehyde dehydrogenase [Fusarium austroafricanum]